MTQAFGGCWSVALNWLARALALGGITLAAGAVGAGAAGAVGAGAAGA